MSLKQKKKGVLLFADGTSFEGDTIGKEGSAFGEICFNTGMSGYQEIFTDPSYFGQLMVMTNVHIGNYGIHTQEQESSEVRISGLICRNFSVDYSRPDAESSLVKYLDANNILALTNVDTRAIVKHIRTHGAMNALISSNPNIDELKIQLADVPDMNGLELASKVSTTQPYFFGNESATHRVAVLDIGVKRSILKNLASRDCYLKIFPHNATFEEMMEFKPDGFFLSNGPGDPKPLKEAQQLAKKIIEKNRPLFGICLGHQVIALANGITTSKMHNGHRGINHPVKNLLTGKGEITSQNHGFVVELSSLKNNPEFEVTHVHLNDHSVAGMKMKNKNCFSVQFHPEAGPGPHDSLYLFDQFISNLKSSA